jgi:ABC-type cobalamin transport system permease subunit
MSVTTPRTEIPTWWWVHDIGVGFLSGFGVGSVAGLFLNRLFENNVVVLICAILGAIAGIYVLIQNHRQARRFLSGVVVVGWVLLVLSAGFIALLVWAVATFE